MSVWRERALHKSLIFSVYEDQIITTVRYLSNTKQLLVSGLEETNSGDELLALEGGGIIITAILQTVSDERRKRS